VEAVVATGGDVALDGRLVTHELCRQSREPLLVGLSRRGEQGNACAMRQVAQTLCLTHPVGEARSLLPVGGGELIRSDASSGELPNDAGFGAKESGLLGVATLLDVGAVGFWLTPKRRCMLSD
jgi:hypothetical protein